MYLKSKYKYTLKLKKINLSLYKFELNYLNCIEE